MFSHIPDTKITLFLSLLIIIAAGTTNLSAADSVLVSYQFHATNSDGSPLPEGYYDMEFKFYDDSIAGTMLWSESKPGVYIDAHEVGHSFLSFVDEYVEGGFENMNALFMEVLIEGEVIRPRVRIGSVPHTSVARRVSGDISTGPGHLAIEGTPGPGYPGLITFDVTPENASGIFGAAEPFTMAGQLEITSDANGTGLLMTHGNSGEGPDIELGSSVGANFIQLHPPEPGVPPDPSTPAMELIADAEVFSMRIHPPDPGAAGGPANPAFEATVNRSEQSVKVALTLPASNATPDVELGVSPFLTSLNMGAPGVEDGPTIGFMVPVDAGPSFGVFAAPGSEVMGVEPSPFNDGYSIALYDPTQLIPKKMINLQSFFGDSTLAKIEMDGQSAVPGLSLVTRSNGANISLNHQDQTGGPAAKIVMMAGADGAKLGIGTDAPIEALTVYGNGWFSGDVFTFTDTKAKRNIVPIDDALDKVALMNGYYYDCRTDEYPELNLPENRQIGFLAQEVNEVVPEAVGENDLGLTGVSYSRITALLIEAVKELKTENEDLKARIEALESR